MLSSKILRISSLSSYHRNSLLFRRAAPPLLNINQNYYTNEANTKIHSNEEKKLNDPFPAKHEKVNTQYQIVASGNADVAHFMRSSDKEKPVASNYMLPHPIWDHETASNIQITHVKPNAIVDRLAYCTVKVLRWMFDLCSGYSLGYVDERGWLNRIVFLETVAGVPGMVGAMVRHLHSLRRMERDYGWIHVLLEEAENERMHLMTAMVMKKPSALFRLGILITQGLFLSFFTASYLCSPRFAHRMVGYLEEEAVKTYTNLLHQIDGGQLPLFEHFPAPPIARNYWELSEGALLRDVILAIRADESHHRETNHKFADLSKSKK